MTEDGDDRAAALMDIYGALDELACSLSRAIATVQLDGGKMEQISTLASNVTQIRLLLRELGYSDDQGSDIRIALIHQYIDLEGQVKQLRNDLERASASQGVVR